MRQRRENFITFSLIKYFLSNNKMGSWLLLSRLICLYLYYCRLVPTLIIFVFRVGVSRTNETDRKTMALDWGGLRKKFTRGNGVSSDRG